MASWKRVITTSDDSNYKNSNLAASDIPNSAITTARLAADAVTNAKIADNAIDSEHYTDGSIDSAHLASNSVTTAKITDANVTSAKIATNAIVQAKIADDAVGAAELSTGNDVSSSTDGYVLSWDDTNSEMKWIAAASGTVSSLSDLSITSTAAEINKLDGFTGVAADLNYAKDLRATGVTSSEFDKLDGLTATTAELNFTDGVTSNIQTQLDGKQASGSYQATITGAATTIDSENLTANRAVVSNASGKIAVSAVTSTELGYLDGVTSAIQAQINNKAAAQGSTSQNFAAANMSVSGNLTVSGTTTTINTETVNIQDNIIVLNSNAASTPSEDAGIEVERGSRTNVFINWDESAKEWTGRIQASDANDTTGYTGRVAFIERAASGTSGSINTVGAMFINTASSAIYIYS